MGKPAPVSFFTKVDSRRIGDGHPPALRELVIELDRHVALETTGLAVCRLGNVESPPPPERCQAALVGQGKLVVQVALPEQEPFVLRAPLLAFNVGVKDGEASINLYASLDAPINSLVLISVNVAKADNGRFGSRWVEKIPRIAEGYGSVVELSLKLRRRYRYLDAERSFLTGRCWDGHLNMRATSTFVNGFTQRVSIQRPCTPSLEPSTKWDG